MIALAFLVLTAFLLSLLVRIRAFRKRAADRRLPQPSIAYCLLNAVLESIPAALFARLLPTSVESILASSGVEQLRSDRDDCLQNLVELERCVRDEANFTRAGQFLWRANVIDRLRDRALAEQALARFEAEIAAERIEKPVVIIGWPRTGTTFLLNLLSQGLLGFQCNFARVARSAVCATARL